MLNRVGSYVGLFVSLACPLSCSFGQSVRGPLVAAPVCREPSTPCEPCSDDRPDPPSDPCGEQPCFCSPFVSNDFKLKDAADATGTLIAATYGSLQPTPNLFLPWPSHLVPMADSFPNRHCTVGHGLPLLI